MKTYYKFILNTYLKSFLFVFLIMLSLVVILNILSELEFFRNTDVNFLFPNILHMTYNIYNKLTIFYKLNTNTFG